MIRIHKEGRWIVLMVFIISLGVISAAYLGLSPWLRFPIYTGAVVLLILVMRFFRVPVRRPFLDDSIIVAPSDGKVVAVERTKVNEFLEGECTQVSIFMSIHDVHINYYPAEGRVRYLKYHPGKYLVARHPKSSELNERQSLGIETVHGPVLVRQIAGYVARRVRTYATLDGRARQGREMGFIRFGSRLDVFLPAGSRILVRPGERVRGSVTPIARFK